MKVFLYTAIILATVLIGYNATQLNFSNIFENNSKIALITILSGLCAITLCLILLLSKKIEQRLKG